MRPCCLHRRLRRDQHRRRRVADLRGNSGRDPAALRQRLEAGHLLQRRLARALVDLEVADGLDLALEASLRDGGARAIVGGECELLHVLATDVPLLGDHLGRPELADLLVAVALLPTGRLGERSREAVLLADDHRGRDRDGAHVLDAAGDHEVLGAGHDALGREVHGLLRGPALTVDGHARHVVGQPGDQPGRAGDVAGLRPDRVAATEDHVVYRASVDAGTPHQGAQRVRGQVGGVHLGQCTSALADGGTDRVDDECLVGRASHGRSRLGGCAGTGRRCRRARACRRGGTTAPPPTRCRG